ncbi:MAG: hypothetical protein A2Y15_01400 [Clostridiales bacterium GWF2_36_10]|nr:MAG: hypothetical protein A2Y15_01400 [Clostridiales bacterium GWF2_36_10]HAN22057.1 amidohydrolase [Clostridiales bacterium]
MKKINREVIDTHTHIFPASLAIRAADKVVTYYNLTREGDGTAETLIKGGEAFEDIRFVISAAAVKSEHVFNGNNFILDSAKNDVRFIPLCSFHPDMDYNEGISELQRIKKEGAKGIKLHPDFQKFPIDREDIFSFYKACEELKLPILFHVGDENSDLSSPRRLYNVINRLPDLTVIAAHMCGYQAWDEAEEILIGLPIYTDTSDALIGLSHERLYNMIQKHGADHIMFGSDYPLSLTISAYNALDALPLTEVEKTKIYSGTAKKVFGLE